MSYALLSFLLMFQELCFPHTAVCAEDPCNRECGKEPMTCNYEFNISLETSMNIFCGECPYVVSDCYKTGCIPAGGISRLVTVVNKMIPGPPIMVCEDDTVVVKVTNNLRVETTSIHWHGIHQVGTFFMDGLPHISQFPILPSDSFEYEFKASPHGTHMWHGHSGFQESDGLFGAFIVRRNEPDHIKSLYDFDLPEHTISVWHWYKEPTEHVLVPILHRNDSVVGFGFLINGKAALKKFHTNASTISTPREQFNVQKGYRYRFRLLYNGAIYCPVKISIDDHTLKMIASETSHFQPVEVDSFMVGAGDRFDFILDANKKEGCYIMRFRGLGDCGPPKAERGVHEEAILCYGNSTIDFDNTSYEEGERSGLLLNPMEEFKTDYINQTLLHLPDLNCSETNDDNYSGVPNVTMYVEIQSKLYESARFPGAWHQFDYVTFEYPALNFLRNKFQSNELCTAETKHNYCNHDFCSCTYYKEIPKNSMVEIVLVDSSLSGDQDHPVHLHGYKFQIVAMEVVGPNITLEDIKQQNDRRLIKKNFNAISKDTVSVPNKGYAILRFNASNPGIWLFHCHITNHMDLGMAILFKVGTTDEIMSMCSNRKQCGNWPSSASSKYSSFIVFLAVQIVIHFLYSY